MSRAPKASSSASKRTPSTSSGAQGSAPPPKKSPALNGVKGPGRVSSGGSQRSLSGRKSGPNSQMGGQNGAQGGAPNGQPPQNMGGDPGSMYGMGGPMGGGMGSMYGMGGPMGGGMGSMYGMGGPMGGGVGSMYGMGGPMGGGMGSMYGMGGMGSMMGGGMGSMYGGGMGSMYGGGMGSMYGGGMGSMYSMGGMGSMMGGGMGSMYGGGMGSMYGGRNSMYGMGSMMGGGGYFGGSLYGGSLFGAAGSLYGQGGSLYGGNDAGSVMGSMYGMGSMYQTGGPHTSLGVVRKKEVEGFSYTFASNMGNVKYKREEPSPEDRAPKKSPPTQSSSLREKERTTSSDAAEKKPEAPGSNGKEKRTVGNTADSSNASASEPKDAAKSKGSDTKEGEKSSAREKSNESSKPVESIMKRREVQVPEAPKSPPANRVAPATNSSAPLTAAIPLSSDYKVHSVVIVEEAGGAAGIEVKGQHCTVGKDSFEMDEVIKRRAGAKNEVPQSTNVLDMIEHLLSGHNASLLISDDTKATESSHSVAKTTIKKLLELLAEPKRNSYSSLHFSFCALQAEDKVADLLDASSQPRPLEVGVSPLYGPAIMDIKSVHVKTAAEFDELFTAAAARGKGESMLVGSLVLKQVRAGTAGGKNEVFLSSLFVAMSQKGPKAFADIADKSSTLSLEVFRYAVGGPSVCVHTFSVQHSNSDSKTLFEGAKQVSAVQNSAPRSGNVRRFVDFTSEQLKRLQERRDSTADAAAKAELSTNVERLSQILEDATKLLNDPQNTEPTVYRAPKNEAGESAANTEAAPSGAPPGKSPSKSSSTNIATVFITDTDSCRAYSVAGNTVTANGRSHPVEEVLKRENVKPKALGSATTTRIMDSFLKGYNGAIMVTDSEKIASTPLESAAIGAVYEVVDGALKRSGSHGVRLSIALVSKDMKAIDLCKDKAVPTPLEVSSSPLFGPVVHNAELRQVQSIADLDGHLQEARKTCARFWNPMSVVCIGIVHCFTEKDDTYVSSLLISFCGCNDSIYKEALEQSSPLRDLYRYAFGGAASTVYIVSASSDDDVSKVAEALGTQNMASKVRNRSPRLGSIKNFIQYTKSSLEKRRERLQQVSDTQEKEKQERVMGPMKRMLDDHEKVISDPKNNFPRSYSAEGALPSSPREMPNSAARAASAAVSPSTAPSKDAPAADANGAAGKKDTPASFTEPHVVVFVDREVAKDEKKVSIGNKDFAVDDVIRRSAAGGECHSISELSERLSGVHNCSLISASSASSAPISAEPVWIHFQQVLEKAFGATKKGEQAMVDLTFAIVSSNEMVADLLGAADVAEPKPLEMVSSPIYGPRIHGTTIVSAKNVAELKQCMEKALKQATAHAKAIHSDNAMMVGTAVLRRKAADGDVLVASLMGTLTGLSAQGYQEALEKASCVRPALLSCAYGGPSATVTIVNLSNENESVQNMVSTMVGLSKKQHNLVSRSGSVQAFVKYTEGSAKRELERASSATGEAKERHQQKANRLQPVVEDHKRLLEDFSAPVPAYPSSGRSRGGDRKAGGSEPQHGASDAAKKDGAASSNKVNTVAIFSKPSSTLPASAKASAEKEDSTHIKANVAGENRSCAFDEVITHPDAASPIASEKIGAAVKQFLSGYNAALLCYDTAASNVGSIVASWAVGQILAQMGDKAELYFSVNVMKDSTTKDVLTSGAAYVPLQVSNSPVFGPVVHNAKMDRLTAASAFDGAFGTACKEVVAENSVCVATLVLKTVEDEKDIILRSMLISVTGNASTYMEVINAGPKGDRKLFQYAVQGSCSTVGVLGLTEKVDESSLSDALNVYSKLYELQNRSMRNGSLRRFLAYSTNAVTDMKERVQRAPDDRQRSVLEKRLASLEAMMQDSRSMIESPQGKVPQTYA